MRLGDVEGRDIWRGRENGQIGGSDGNGPLGRAKYRGLDVDGRMRRASCRGLDGDTHTVKKNLLAQDLFPAISGKESK